MSVCDEGWGPEDGYVYRCPCLDTYADNEVARWKCNLNVFEEHDQYAYENKKFERQDLRPITCRHAPALRAVLGDREMYLIARRTHEALHDTQDSTL